MKFQTELEMLHLEELLSKKERSLLQKDSAAIILKDLTKMRLGLKIHKAGGS